MKIVYNFIPLLISGTCEKTLSGAHSKYKGKYLNLEYASWRNAVFASEFCINSTKPI